MMAAPVVDRGHGADDAAVAVEERHGHDDLVLLGVVEALGQELAVVDDVVMGEQDALGQAGGAAGVLDVGHVVDGDMVGQLALGVEQRRPLGRVEVDGVFQLEIEAVAGAAQNLLVVGALVFVPEEERLHARAFCRVNCELVGAVGGIDVDQRGAGAGAAHVHHDPLDAVGGPEADAVAAADAERPEPAGHAVGLGAELGPGKALSLVAGGHGQAVGKAIGGAVEQVADGQFQQRPARTAGVAQRAKVLFYRHGSEARNLWLGTRKAVYTMGVMRASVCITDEGWAAPGARSILYTAENPVARARKPANVSTLCCCSGCHCVALLAVALYRTFQVKTKADYLVAGRSLPAVVLVLTLLTSWIGAGSLFAGAENAYKNGFAALWQPAGGWLGLLLIYFIAPRARKFAQFTLPDLLEARYNQTARVLGTFAILFAYVGITSYQFKGGGNVLHLIFPDTVTPELGTYIIAAFVIVTTALAGMSSVAYMDVAIGSLVTVICIIAAPMLFFKAGGWAGLHAALPPQYFEVLGNYRLSPTCAAVGGMGMVRALEFLVPTMLLMLGNQVMYQKFFSAKSEKDARRLGGRMDSGHRGAGDADCGHRGLWPGALSHRRSGAASARDYSLHGAARAAGGDGRAAAGRGLRQGHFDGFELSVFAGYQSGRGCFCALHRAGSFEQTGPDRLAAGRGAAGLLGALSGGLCGEHSGKDAVGLHDLFRRADAGGAGGVLLIPSA